MSRSHVLLPLLVAGALLLLSGALGQHATSTTPPEGPPAPAESAEALRLLDQAVEAYATARVGWMEMTLWQRVLEENNRHEVHGRFVAAPGHRLRLELKVNVGRTEGELKLASNGKILRQSYRLGPGEPEVTRSELPSLGETWKTPEAVDWARSVVLAEQSFTGAAPLLRQIRQRVQQARHGKGQWQGRQVIEVTGRWPDDPAKLNELPAHVRPRYQPRRVGVSLDAQTLWPCRVEWWGAAPGRAANVLLLEMEFRDPVLNRPLPPEQCAREFTLAPG